MFKHPLTIHFLWTFFAWSLALFFLSWEVLLAWFVLSFVGWGVAFFWYVRQENRWDREWDAIVRNLQSM